MLLYRRHTLAPVGIAGSWPWGWPNAWLSSAPKCRRDRGGVIVLAAAALAPDPPAADHVGYPPLLVALCVFTALAPLVPGGLDPATTGLTVAGGLAFYVCGAVRRCGPTASGSAACS